MRGILRLWEELERQLDMTVNSTINAVLSNEAPISNLAIYITS